MRWLYADGVEAITDRLVEDELRRRFPAGFRVSPREDQIIPQDVYVAISTSKTPSVPVPNNWNAKSKNSVIWGRCYGFRV